MLEEFLGRPEFRELALCVSSLEHEGDDNAPKQHLGFHQYDRVECAVLVGQTRFVV